MSCGVGGADQLLCHSLLELCLSWVVTIYNYMNTSFVSVSSHFTFYSNVSYCRNLMHTDAIPLIY